MEQGRRRHRSSPPAGQAGQRHRRIEADHVDGAGAVRPDQPAARSQRPLRLLGQEHAGPRAGAVRKAQGADLPAYRFARTAGRLHRRPSRQTLEVLDGEHRTTTQFAKQILDKELGQAEQAHLRQHEDLRSLRDHPDARRRRRTCPSRSRSCTTSSTRRFLAVFFPAAEFLVTTRYHASRRPPVQDRRQGDGQPRLAGGLRQGSATATTRTTPTPGAGAPRARRSRPKRSTANGLVTKPPARYTEATLLSAMEGAGKLIDDDELREAMARKGPRHAGHARRDHRRPDRREVHAARRPRAASRPPRRSS